LDAVLATGDRLLALYTGSDARDDSPRNPSAQLRELIDYLQHSDGQVDVHRHGLQAFGASAFDGSGPGRSFASEWLGAARAILDPPARRAGLGPVARPDWRPVAAASAAGQTDGGPAEGMRRVEEVLGDLAAPA